jgi:hypothetical protein
MQHDVATMCFMSQLGVLHMFRDHVSRCCVTHHTTTSLVHICYHLQTTYIYNTCIQSWMLQLLQGHVSRTMHMKWWCTCSCHAHMMHRCKANTRGVTTLHYKNLVPRFESRTIFHRKRNSFPLNNPVSQVTSRSLWLLQTTLYNLTTPLRVTLSRVSRTYIGFSS